MFCVKPGDLMIFDPQLGEGRNLYTRDERAIINLSEIPVFPGEPCLVLETNRGRPFVSERTFDFVHVVTSHGTGWVAGSNPAEIAGPNPPNPQSSVGFSF